MAMKTEMHHGYMEKKKMSWEKEVMAGTRINNRLFHKVQSVSIFLSKMSKEYFLLAQKCSHSYNVS